MTVEQTAINARDFIWAQKYRPNKIDQCILPQRIKTHFEGMVASEQVSHLLLVGGPGMGKCLGYESELVLEVDSEFIKKLERDCIAFHLLDDPA